MDKLRSNILQIHELKEQAIRDEKYNEADTMRTKTLGLQAQLRMMETQPNAELLRNCVSQWQGAFAGHVNECLNSGLRVLKVYKFVFVAAGVMDLELHLYIADLD